MFLIGIKYRFHDLCILNSLATTVCWISSWTTKSMPLSNILSFLFCSSNFHVLFTRLNARVNSFFFLNLYELFATGLKAYNNLLIKQSWFNDIDNFIKSFKKFKKNQWRKNLISCYWLLEIFVWSSNLCLIKQTNIFFISAMKINYYLKTCNFRSSKFDIIYHTCFLQIQIYFLETALATWSFP